jgi:hypothetical protein
MKYKVNDKIFANKVHARGGPYCKGVVYDSEAMKLPDRVVADLMKKTMGPTGPHIFEEVD